MSSTTNIGSRGPVLTPGFTTIPYGAKIHYVHNNAGSAFSDLPSEFERIYPTIHEAMPSVESGRGDIIQLLQNHTENIDSATYLTQTTATLPDYVTIHGPETGAPAVLTWSTATASMVASSVGFKIDGSRADGSFGIDLQCAGPSGSTAIDVAAPIVWSAARGALNGCFVNPGIDADQRSLITFTTTADADFWRFTNNMVRGTVDSDTTTVVRLVGLSHAVISNNDIAASTSAAAVGPIQALTTAPVNCTIANNIVHSNGASATGCITGMAAMSGSIGNNFCRNGVNTSLAHIVTAGAMSLYENYGSNDDAETGALLGTVSA